VTIEIRRPGVAPLWHLDPATGYAVNVPFTAWFTDDPRFPGAVVGVEIDLAADRSHLRVVAVKVSDAVHEVTSKSLRAVPVPQLRDEAVAAATYAIDVDRGIGKGGGVHLTPVAADERAFLAERVQAMVTRPRKPREDPGPERLRAVAEVYRAALAEGNPKVRRAVMDKIGLSQAVAAAWIALARERIDPETDRAYLGPAVGPKAGEAEQS
jgi:hypothetical protein